jgi:hypothetical protein
MPPPGGACTGAPSHTYTLVVSAAGGADTGPAVEVGCVAVMSPFWIWTQVAIVVFVLIGMVVAITKLA